MEGDGEWGVEMLLVSPPESGQICLLPGRSWDASGSPSDFHNNSTHRHRCGASGDKSHGGLMTITDLDSTPIPHTATYVELC